MDQDDRQVELTQIVLMPKVRVTCYKDVGRVGEGSEEDAVAFSLDPPVFSTCWTECPGARKRGVSSRGMSSSSTTRIYAVASRSPSTSSIASMACSREAEG
jgi:hypothetical protein